MKDNEHDSSKSITSSSTESEYKSFSSIKNESCFKKYFCCCLSNTNSETEVRNYYIKKWKNYVNSQNNEESKFLDAFVILTNIWGHKQFKLSDFDNVRINPNLLINGFRNDLEFYIPQICTFLVFGSDDIIENFTKILCKCSFFSYFFCHRVLWFLRSMLCDNQYQEK